MVWITCSNSGGPGQFHISSEGQGPISPGEIQHDSVQLGPFQLCPATFALDRQEQMQLQIVFEPKDIGEHTQVFTLKCNNGTQMSYHLSGKGQAWLLVSWLQCYSAAASLCHVFCICWYIPCICHRLVNSQTHVLNNILADSWSAGSAMFPKHTPPLPPPPRQRHCTVGVVARSFLKGNVVQVRMCKCNWVA